MSATRDEARRQAAEGYLLLEMGERALAELATVAPHARDRRWHALSAEALRQLKRYTESEAHFREALRETPDDVELLIGLAWCLKRTERLPDAIETLLTAYQSHAQEPIVLYNLACYYTLAGDKTQALSWLGRALRMEPSLRDLIDDESDFDALRDDQDFRFIVDCIRSPESE